MRFLGLATSVFLLFGGALPASAAAAGGRPEIGAIPGQNIVQTLKSMRMLMVDACRSNRLDRNRVKRMRDSAFTPYRTQWPPTFRVVIGSLFNVVIAQPDPCGDAAKASVRKFWHDQLAGNAGKLYIEYIGDKANVDRLAKNMYDEMSRQVRGS
jgi:hypothetical protein